MAEEQEICPCYLLLEESCCRFTYADKKKKSIAEKKMQNTASIESVMVCYYGSWAVYRQGDGKFDVEEIDPGICTHIIYGFAGLGADNKIKVLDPWNELCDNYGKCAYDRFTGLKQKNVNLRTLLAVGGWNEGSVKYSNMAADPAKRKTFIDSAVELLNDHNFDGLDLDWEYPTQRGGAPQDKENFVVLLGELKEALHAHGMILTAAVPAAKKTVDPAYDIPGMAQHLDLLNLMAYDLHGAWDPFTHHQSGLFAYPADEGDNLYLNVDFGVNYWLEGGMPSNKIAMGIPLYGRCWSLDSPDQHGYYAPASQPGRPGPLTNSPGSMGYNELCEKIKNEGWTVEIEPDCNEPHTYSMAFGRTWCSYEDPDSVVIKANYAREKNLAGMMVWSLETDDFHGFCHDRPFNLIKTIVEAFTGGAIPTPVPQSTTTRDPNEPTTTSSTTPNTPPPEGVCQKPGINPDPDNCHHYWVCTQNVNGSYDMVSEPCTPETLFNPIALICDWDYVVCALDDVCPNECQ